MQLSFVVPGILSPEYDICNCPNLNKLIRHAKITQLDLSYSDIILGAEYEINTSIAKQIAQSRQLKTYQCYLICEPTHLRLDGNSLLISESTLLQLDKSECTVIINDINNHFNGDLEIFYITDNLWLIGINNLHAPINNFAIVDILGQNVNQFLSNNILLNQIINEVQMLLFHHDINKIRNDEGSLSVNSIWLWDKILHNKLDVDSFEIIDNLHSPSSYGDTYSWLQQMQHMDDTIWQKLVKQQTLIKQINIYLPYRNKTIKAQITPLDKFKFWRNNNIKQLTKDYDETKHN